MMRRGEKKRYAVLKRIIAVVLAAVLLPLMPVQRTRAADTGIETVSIEVTYGQTEARKMLDEFNQFRTQAGLSEPSVYDYGLEKCAMQRAAEMALDYVYTRPDGRSVDTIYGDMLPGFTGTDKEMVFLGETTAALVADAWHQMGLDDVFRSNDRYIGAARACYQGTYYWVVICSNTPTQIALTGAYDGTETRSISILSNQIQERVISGCPTGTLNLSVGDYYDVSNCSASIKVAGHARSNEYCQLVGTVSVMIEDTSVLFYNGTSLYAQKSGSSNVTLSCGGLSASPFQVIVGQPDFSQATIDAIPDQNYTGYAVRPNVKVRLGNTLLTENLDYIVQYGNNVNQGTAYVTVIGTGSYSGSKSAFFRIVAPSVANATVSSISDQAYTGNAICPTITVLADGILLREGTDYTVSYSNNVNPGTATVLITGIGSYSGSKTVTFRIMGQGLANATITDIPDQLYTGSDIRPTMSVTLNNIALRQGIDYSVSYSNNRNVGTATITVRGIGSYSGTKTVTFRIIGKDIGNTTVSSIDTQRYTGAEIRPAVTVKIGNTVLKQDVDYTLTYRDNRQPGTASITINGAGSYSGSKTVTFKIAQPTMSSAMISVADQTYNGKEKTPKVTVKLNETTLSEGDDYEVEYRNNTKPGKATVVITGVGDYSGTKKVTFVIVPKKITWRSIKAKTKAASLSWKKDSYASGYELYRSRKKSSGYKRIGTLEKNKYTACTNHNLKSGTYYYKVRSYVLVDGTKYYGAFSSVKSVKIK